MMDKIEKFINDYWNTKSDKLANKIINLIESNKFGVPQNMVEVVDSNIKFTTREADGLTGDFYYYYGPASKRDFCKYMLQKDQVFSSGEIELLAELLASGGETYLSFNGRDYVPGPIMPYGGPGGPNCRHEWRKFRGKLLLQPAVTDRTIKTLVNKSIFK